MDVPAREPPPKVEILPADTPPARRIALLHPIKHPKTLLICLFIGTAHWFAQIFMKRHDFRFGWHARALSEMPPPAEASSAAHAAAAAAGCCLQ